MSGHAWPHPIGDALKCMQTESHATFGSLIQLVPGMLTDKMADAGLHIDVRRPVLAPRQWLRAAMLLVALQPVNHGVMLGR